MSPRHTSLLAVLLLPLAFSAGAQDTPASRLLHERLPLFAYDRDASLGLDERTVSDRGGVSVHDVSFLAIPGSPEGRITAYMAERASRQTGVSYFAGLKLGKSAPNTACVALSPPMSSVAFAVTRTPLFVSGNKTTQASQLPSEPP
jgi:hypothetical protein